VVTFWPSYRYMNRQVFHWPPCHRPIFRKYKHSHDSATCLRVTTI
jgi:hypothetical protein